MLNIVPVRVREIVAIHSPFIFFLLNIEKLIYESFRHFTQFIFFYSFLETWNFRKWIARCCVRADNMDRWASGPLRRGSSFPSNNNWGEILSYRWWHLFNLFVGVSRKRRLFRSLVNFNTRTNFFASIVTLEGYSLRHLTPNHGNHSSINTTF